MPSGDRLKKEIADILNFTPGDYGQPGGDDIVRGAIDLYSRENYAYVNTHMREQLMSTAINISKAMSLSISIDNFIDARGGEGQIVFCGKVAIVSAILEAENSCALSLVDEETLPDEFIHHKDDIEDQRKELLKSSWYPLLFQKITEGCRIDELAARLDNISFIIFNYDRCFEYFMYTSLMVYYDIDHDRAKGIVQSLHINHPYGTVGDLWDIKGRITFGKLPDSEQLIALAKNIKTFTESREREEDMKSTVKYCIERADRIIFLGFAYHEQNIDLLFNNKGVMVDSIPPAASTSCYGTGYKISEHDLPYVRKLLMQANEKIQECILSDVLCAKFFQDFWYSLSFKETRTDPDGVR